MKVSIYIWALSHWGLSRIQMSHGAGVGVRHDSLKRRMALVCDMTHKMCDTTHSSDSWHWFATWHTNVCDQTRSRGSHTSAMTHLYTHGTNVRVQHDTQTCVSWCIVGLVAYTNESWYWCASASRHTHVCAMTCIIWPKLRAHIHSQISHVNITNSCKYDFILNMNLNPLKKQFTRSYVRNVRKRQHRFSDPFCDLVQNTSLVRFLYLLCLCRFCKKPHGTCLEEVQENSRVLRIRSSWYPTSNCLGTWLIPSGTTRSKQYNESTMVWHNLPPHHLLKCLPLLVTLFLFEKTRQSTGSGGTGASCVRPWLTCDIVETGSFRRGWAQFRGDQRLGTIHGTLLPPGYLLAILKFCAGRFLA